MSLNSGYLIWQNGVLGTFDLSYYIILIGNGPCHKKYYDVNKRLESLSIKYGKNYIDEITQIAEGGFFCNSTWWGSTELRCFYCDGKANRKEMSLYPSSKIYHRYLYPNCPYAKLICGENPCKVWHANLESETCVICLVAQRQLTALPCGHFAVCARCGLAITECPICRKRILAFVKTFSS